MAHSDYAFKLVWCWTLSLDATTSYEGQIVRMSLSGCCPQTGLGQASTEFDTRYSQVCTRCQLTGYYLIWWFLRMVWWSSVWAILNHVYPSWWDTFKSISQFRAHASFTNLGCDDFPSHCKYSGRTRGAGPQEAPDHTETEMLMFDHVLFDMSGFCSSFVTMPSLVISLFLNLSGAYPKDTARPWRTSLSSHCTPWPHTACEIQSMRFGDPEMLKEWTINKSLAVPDWVYLQIFCSPEDRMPLHPMHYFRLFVNVIVRFMICAGQRIW